MWEVVQAELRNVKHENRNRQAEEEAIVYRLNKMDDVALKVLVSKLLGQ